MGRLAASLWAFWYRRGHVREGRIQLDAALALSAVDAEASIRTSMLEGSALLAEHEGDYAEAFERMPSRESRLLANGADPHPKCAKF